MSWNTHSVKQPKQLVWSDPGVRYQFKRGRFGLVEGQKDKFRLYTIVNPFSKTGKSSSYIQQWDSHPATAILLKSAVINEPLAALAVRDDGKFVAIGSMFSGSVSIYIAFSLQQILHVPNAHAMFITGLQFLPVLNPDGPSISNLSEATVLSISVDNRICYHNIYHRREYLSFPF
jgi:prolactin regulatory element-binding protein